MNDLIAMQQAEAQENGRTLDREEAFEEVVADSMEEILADGRVMELMQKLEAEDHSLAGKVKKFFQDIVQLLKDTIKAYSYFAPDSREGNMVREMRDIYAQLQEVFAEGIYEGGKNHSKMGVKENTTGEGGVKYSGKNDDGFKEYDIVSAVYEIRSEKAARGHDLVKIGTMPKLYHELFDLSGEVFVSNDHLYQNMVSKATAVAEGRPSEKPGADYHELGEEKIIRAIEQFQDPILLMESLKDYKEPRLVAILDEKGNDRQNLMAVLELYASATYPGKGQRRNHVLITVYEKSGLPDYIGATVEKNRLLYIRKRAPSDTAASLQLAGAVSKETLKKNVARFNKKVKEFKEKNKINYSTRKGETTSYTPRSLLMNADESIAIKPIQQKALKEYREIIGKLQLEEKQLEDAQQQLEAIKDIKGLEHKRQQLELRSQIIAIKDRMTKLRKELSQYEGYEAIKDMVTRERKRVVQQQLADYRAKYGTIKSGEKKVRDDALPKSTDGKNKVSLTARTVKGAKATTDEFAELIDEQVADGKLAYLPITNNATTKAAREKIERDGWEETLEDWKNKVKNSHVSAELTATGALLLKEAAQSGNKEAWLDILFAYQHMGTSAGQAIQALRILKQLNPEDRMGMMKRSITQLIKDTGIKFKADDIIGKIDPDIIEAYKQAETYEEENWALKEIGASIAQYVPSTFMDKWTALRYLNMLGNPRTQIRNIVGNAAMSMVTTVKNATAIGIEQLAYYASGGKFRRTKAFVSPAMIKAAGEDFKIVKSMILGDGKYSDSSWASSQLAQAVKDNQRIFKNKFLEKYRNITNRAMDQGDLIFSKAAYANALAGYLKANGVKNGDFSNVDAELMETARIYAVKEAQEATFRDTNAFSRWISKLGRRSDSHWLGKLVSEGSVPFRKTPANILVRAEEYSPLGFVNTVGKMIKKAASTTKLTEKGNVIGAFARGGEMITGADIVNSLAKGLTGTGLFFIGMWLQSVGVLVGGPDDDEDLDYYQEQNGQQNYALRFGDVYITIDFLSPAAVPMFIGAQIQKLSEDGGIELKDWEKSLTSIADPLIEMSMLQGISDALDSIRFSDSNIAQLFISFSANILTQGLTNSWLGQIERGSENSRQTTYVDENSALPNWMQRMIGKASAKIPGWDYQQIPYINAWGEEEENPSVPVNMAYNMLSPSYISRETSDNVSRELTRLNEVQSDVNVFPSTPDREYNNKPLSADEYVALAKAQGQTQRQIVEELIASEVYAGLTDTYKAKAIKYAYEYAKENAQMEVLGRSGYSSKWMGKIEDDVAGGILEHIMSDKDAVAGMIREREPRIKKAAEAKARGDMDTYLEIVEKIVEEGYFKWKDVSAAVKDEVKEMGEE